MKNIKRNFLGLLRKLHIIDYLIVIIVLLGFVIAYKFFNPQKEWTTVVVSATDIPIYQAKAIEKGDVERDSKGEVTAKVESVYTYDAPVVSGKYATNKNIFLKVKLLASVNPRSGEYKYKNKIFKIGSPVEFLFTSGYLKGLISDMGSLKKNYTTKKIKFKLYSQWPWFADSVQIGSGEYDANGNQILEIVDKNVVPAEVTVETAEGETLLRTDPRKVDIDITALIKVSVFRGGFVYRNDMRVLIGDKLDFNLENTRVEDAYIVSIE